MASLLKGLLCLSSVALVASLPAAEPQLLLHLPFDGSPDAKVSSGDPKPLKAAKLSYAPGLNGQAVKMSAGAVLEYVKEGNLKQSSGTVTLWFKPSWNPAEQVSSPDRSTWHCLFAEPRPQDGKRAGSGMLWLWCWGACLRADSSDKGDSYITGGLPPDGGWTHMAFCWGPEGKSLFINGRSCGSAGDGDSPFSAAAPVFDKPVDFKSFFVGNSDSAQQADGLIDDFKIYDAPLSPERIMAEAAEKIPFTLKTLTHYFEPGSTAKLLWTLESVSGKKLALDVSWRLLDPSGKEIAKAVNVKCSTGVNLSTEFIPAAPGTFKLVVDADGIQQSSPLWVLGKGNPYLNVKGKLTTSPVETLDFVKGVPPARFIAAGECRKSALSGRSYFEAGSRMHDRFAVKVELPEAGVPYLIEWDYPDDKLRTMEMVAQSASGASDDYNLQTGVFCGGEYPNSMKTLTHRSILWAGSKDIAFIFMTARPDAPAAVSELRISKILGGLPDAAIKDASPVKGWNRTVGVYFEDPAIAFDFGLKNGGAMPQFETLLDRLTAYMKWSGQNMLCYPGVWYQGPIGEAYQPRVHADDYIGCILSKFERQGLSFMPTVNLHNIPLPRGLDLNAAESSAVMILSDGKPNGKWHGTPPNFNPLHPDSQRAVESAIDAMLARYASSPAFKGVILHLTKHTCPWFGSIEAGYNDYCIDSFEKDTGIKVAVDRKAPLRGKLYYDWLMANARDKWIDWRCQKIAAWYKRLASKLESARTDLKLGVFSYSPTVSETRDLRYGQPGYPALSSREAGLDPKYYADDSRIIICQTMYPADYRWGAGGKSYPTDKMATMRTRERNADSYELLKGAADPWINFHDRYFEDPVGAVSHGGKPGSPLPAPWMKEHGWRVSTLNPNNNEFISQYILPLRFGDVLGFTKGGFLIGTCGYEAQLVDFARAYRALPCVKFSDVPGSSDTVKVRSYKGQDALWLYAVNTERTPAKVEIPLRNLTELSSNAKLDGSSIELAPYQIRSFKANPDTILKEVKCATSF